MPGKRSRDTLFKAILERNVFLERLFLNFQRSVLSNFLNLRNFIHIKKHGGADRDRTGDLRRAKPALSQLSYSPSDSFQFLMLSRNGTML
jgi:hypothetical protein